MVGYDSKAPVASRRSHPFRILSRDVSRPENHTYRLPNRPRRRRSRGASAICTMLQDLGEALCALDPSRLAALALPERLVEAIALARTITRHEGRRRQMQFIGRLMRDIDPEPMRAALVRVAGGSARGARALRGARAMAQTACSKRRADVDAFRRRASRRGPRGARGAGRAKRAPSAPAAARRASSASCSACSRVRSRRRGSRHERHASPLTIGLVSISDRASVGRLRRQGNARTDRMVRRRAEDAVARREPPDSRRAAA